MSLVLTNRQKQIVNPYADQTFQDRFNGQLGITPYDYNAPRNRFVLDAIQDSYINYQVFPNIGQELGPESGLPEEVNTLTGRDARAYFSLYPQNGKVGPDPVTGDSIMMPWSGEEAKQQLMILVQRLEQNGVLNNYQTQTTELSILPETAGRRDQQIANLIAIESAHSLPYLTRMRASLGLRNDAVINSDTPALQNIEISTITNTFIGGDPNMDLFTWTENAQPGTQQEKIYFNVVEDKFYYVVRTSLTDSADLDMGWLIPELQEENGQAVLSRYQMLVDHGLAEILKFSGRHSVGNLQDLLRQHGGLQAPAYLQYNLGEEDLPRFRKYNAFSSKSPRPGSRWIFAVTVDQETITNLSVEQAISFEEFELSAFQKAKIIADPEKTQVTNREPRFFHNLTLAQNLITVSQMLEEYADTLREEGIGSVLSNDVDLQLESEKVNSFYDLFGTFYSFNQVALKDDDLVQFYFDDAYRLLYICINGVAYTRGGGNPNFEPPAENDTPTAILDAFAYLTSTTFSYIYNSLEITNEFLLTTPATRKPWGNFVTSYTFPTPDISPKKIDALRRSYGMFSVGNSLSKQKNIFTKLTEFHNIPTHEKEKLFNSRQRYVFLTNALFASGCDTGAAKALRETTVAIAMMEGKISLRSYIRRIIHLLKTEVVQDETTKQLLTQYNPYADRALGMNSYEDVSREVQRMVENQIFCSLDVLGDLVGEAVLQATDSQPLASQLSRPVKNTNITLEFKKIPMMNKQNAAKNAYRAVINQIITNFLKSLLAGVAKDLITAIAGCAPESEESRLDQLQNAFRKYNYGAADLNDLIIEIDVVQIAKDVGLVNVQREVVDGVEIETTIDPTVPQLQELISDISKMVTPTELGMLLSADATDLLYRLILETIQDGMVRWRSGVEIVPAAEDQGIGEAIIQAIKEEFEGEELRFIYDNINPADYNQMEFTQEKIKEFFAAIGDALGEAGQDDSPSAIDEFCRSRDPDLTTLKLRLSEIQLSGQIDQVVSSKINKINSYCDYLRSMQSMQIQLDQLLNSLPMMEFYNDILRLISKILPWLTSMLSAWYKSMFGKDPVGVTDVTYNLYSTALGVELFYQSYTQLRNTIVVPNLSRTSTGRYVYDVPVRNARYTGHNTHTPSNLLEEVSSGLRLPYAKFGVAGRSVTLSPSIGSYATSTAPEHLRNLWGNSVPLQTNPPNPQHSEMMYSQRNKDYVSPYLTDIQYRPPYNGAMPSVALSVRNKEDPLEPGIRIYGYVPRYNRNRRTFTQINNFDREYLLAEWTPDDFGMEGESAVSYGLLTSQFVEVGTQELMTLAGNVVLPSIMGGRGAGLSRPQKAVQQMINSFFMQLDRLIDSAAPFNPANDEKRSEVKVIANSSERLELQVHNGFTSDIAKRRLPRYVYGTNLDVFKENTDPCVTYEERSNASAWIGVLQSRIQKFFINTLPLARVYPTWNNVGTVKLITDYLYRKIRSQLVERNLLNPLLQNMQMIEKVYANFPSESPQLILPAGASPEENLKTIIEKMFVNMLTNIAKSSEYININRSLYEEYEILGEESPIRSNYLTSLYLFFKEMKSRLVSEDLPNYGRLGLTPEQKDRAVQLLNEITDDEELTVSPYGEQLGSYYFPLGPLYASYLIYYDHSVRIAERYSDINYRSETEIAASDDAFLTAVRGQSYSEFSAQYVGYPVAVMTYNRSNNVTYYNTPQVQRRINYLDEILDDMTLSDISAAERRRIEAAGWGELANQNENLLKVIDEGWRYSSPNNAPAAYYAVMKTLLDKTWTDYSRPYMGRQNAMGEEEWWTRPEYRNGPQNGTEWERVWLFYQSGVNPEAVLVNPAFYDGETEHEAAWLSHIEIDARMEAGRRIRALGMGYHLEDRAFTILPGPYGGSMPGNFLSIDEMCDLSRLRLDSYVAGVFDLPPLNSEEAWRNSIEKRIVGTTAMKQLERSLSLICENTGPTTRDIRIEKNALQALITPNE